MTDIVETVNSRLTELEAVIDRGAKSFVEVGNALLEIREARLHKERGFERFEDYCQERWGFSRFQAYRTINASVVVGMLPAGNIPTYERQARELTPLLKAGPDRVSAVWAEIVEETGGLPTTKQIKEKVRRVLTNGNGNAPTADGAAVSGPVRKPVAVRVKEIEALAVDGASSAQIARQLGLGEERVRVIVAQCGLVIPGDQVTNKTRRLNPNHVMDQTVAEIGQSVDMTIGLLQGRWSDLDPARIEEWRSSLEVAVRSVNRLIKELSANVAITA